MDFFSFAYNGKLLITLSNVQSLVTGACFLQLTDIREECCKFMQKNIHISNSFDILKFAETFMCESLLIETQKFLLKNFEIFIKQESFLEIPFEVGFIKKILKMLLYSYVIANSSETDGCLLGDSLYVVNVTF